MLCGPGVCLTTQVMLMVLPTSTNSSFLPKMVAMGTENRIIIVSQLIFMLVARLTSHFILHCCCIIKTLQVDARMYYKHRRWYVAVYVSSRLETLIMLLLFVCFGALILSKFVICN